MGKMQQIVQHPEEIWPLIQMYQAAKKAKNQTRNDPDLDFCYDILNSVSRRWERGGSVGAAIAPTALIQY